MGVPGPSEAAQAVLPRLQGRMVSANLKGSRCKSEQQSRGFEFGIDGNLN